MREWGGGLLRSYSSQALYKGAICKQNLTKIRAVNRASNLQKSRKESKGQDRGAAPGINRRGKEASEHQPAAAVRSAREYRKAGRSEGTGELWRNRKNKGRPKVLTDRRARAEFARGPIARYGRRFCSGEY